MKVGELLKVTRNDIQDFPGDTIQLIMDLQKEGWRAQRSNRNHVMLLAPDGVTKYSASRNANSAKYLSEDIARYKRGEKLLGEPENIDNLIEEAKEVHHEKFPCPHADCPKFYASQEKVNVHVAVDHEGYLKCPDCDEVRDTKQKLSVHRNKAHGYVSPRYKRRKELEANKKAEADTEQVEKVLGAAVEGAREAGRAVGRALRDSGKFDPSLVFDKLPGEPGLDTMDIHHITKGEVDKDLKHLVSSVTEFDPPLEFTPSETVILAPSDAPKISNAEIYHQTRNQLAAGVDPKVVRTDDIEFIDSRDSWVIDHSHIRDRRVGKLEEILKATGLRMEIRVWKQKD